MCVPVADDVLGSVGRALGGVRVVCSMLFSCSCTVCGLVCPSASSRTRCLFIQSKKKKKKKKDNKNKVSVKLFPTLMFSAEFRGHNYESYDGKNDNNNKNNNNKLCSHRTVQTNTSEKKRWTDKDNYK